MKREAALPVLTGLGISSGLVFGLLMDNLALGLALGVAIGAGSGTAIAASAKPGADDDKQSVEADRNGKAD